MPQPTRTVSQAADDFRLRHPRAAAWLDDASTAIKWTTQQIIELIKALVAAILRLLNRIMGNKASAKDDQIESDEVASAAAPPIAKKSYANAKKSYANVAAAPAKESVERVDAEPVDTPKASYARASQSHPDIEDAIFDEASAQFTGLPPQARDMAHEVLAGMVPKLMDPAFVAKMQEQEAQESANLGENIAGTCDAMAQSTGRARYDNRYQAICTEVTQLLGPEVLSKFSTEQPEGARPKQSVQEKLLALIMRTLPDVDDVLTAYLPRQKIQALRQYGSENAQAINELKDWKVMLDAVAHDPSLKVDFSKKKVDAQDDDENIGKPNRPKN